MGSHRGKSPALALHRCDRSRDEKKGDVNTIGLFGEAALIESAKRAVTKAEGFGIIPSYQDIAT